MYWKYGLWPCRAYNNTASLFDLGGHKQESGVQLMSRTGEPGQAQLKTLHTCCTADLQFVFARGCVCSGRQQNCSTNNPIAKQCPQVQDLVCAPVLMSILIRSSALTSFPQIHSLHALLPSGLYLLSTWLETHASVSTSETAAEQCIEHARIMLVVLHMSGAEEVWPHKHQHQEASASARTSSQRKRGKVSLQHLTLPRMPVSKL